MLTEFQEENKKSTPMPDGHQSDWKWTIAAIFGVALAIWAVGKALEIQRMIQYPPAGVAQHAITLSESGKATVVPDTAEVEFSVISEAKAPQDAQRDNTQKMNAIIQFVKDQNIDAKDIKTAAYNLYPKYNYENGRADIVGYTLTQSLRVKVRDIEKLGALLEGVTSRGTNQVGDIRFFVDDPDASKQEARKEAVAKVRAKADELARLMGVRLGRVIAFSESGGDMPPIFYAKAEAYGAGGVAPAPQIEQGTQDITVTVTVTYEIR
ncbi:MAG: SIMPL domain-containing protein [bacterium]|nr:SIMPL domain-containing protein [bacterium]